MNNTTGCLWLRGAEHKRRGENRLLENHVERQNSRPGPVHPQIPYLLHLDLFFSRVRQKTNKRHHGPALQNEYANHFQNLLASVYQHKAKR